VIALFLAPALMLYFGLVFYPVVRTLYNSFFVLDMAHGFSQTFVGLRNYQELLTEDPVFFSAAFHSLAWGLTSPLVEIPIALVLAFVIYTGVPGGRFFRLAWFSPLLLSYVIVAIVWRWIYNADWGVFNTILRAVGLAGLTTDWLGTLETVLPALIVVTTWMWTGFNFVILLAALHSLPSETIDAARVDGASNAQTLWHVIIPMLRTTIVNLLILCFIGKMKIFDLVWVMTKGGPMWASETVSTYVIKRAFNWYTLDLGYPSAIAALWFLVILVLTVLFTRFLNRQESLEF
jgi:multiple sugar transport system permease protein/raffinose/stachyose/melibiose transport system permease protein